MALKVYDYGWLYPGETVKNMIHNESGSAYADHTNINYASEYPTFGDIASVSLPVVQWTGLAMGKLP